MAKIRKTSPTELLKLTIIEAMQNRKAHDISCLDIKKTMEGVADYFIICHGDSTTQVNAIADNVQKEVYEKTGQKPYKTEGERNAVWIIVDYVDIVVHIFHRDNRAFYQIEEMWSDAPVEKY